MAGTTAAAPADDATASVATSVLFSGSTEWDLMGRGSLPVRADELGMTGAGRQLLSPALVPALEGKYVVKLAAGPVSCHVLALTAAGAVYAWGRNESGQLGLPDLRRRNCPTLVDDLKDRRIVGAALGRNHTLVLADDGCVLACGSNKSGQLGTGGSGGDLVSDFRTVDISALGDVKAVRVAAGADFSLILGDNGGVYSFGHPEYGQLGHGSDNKWIEAKKELFNYQTTPFRIESLAKAGVKIVDAACGVNSTAALDSDGNVWTWGWGSYGRLGHKEPKDEFVPRQIENLSKVTSVHAGSQFHYALTQYKQTYFWGQTKSTGEATMYPKAVHDLSGWEVRALTCGASSTMVCAGESVVSWGPSPAFGELGYGDKEMRMGKVAKSSTKPKLVDCLEGATTLDVALGLQFSVMLMQRGKGAGDNVVDKLPLLEEQDVALVPGAGAANRSGGGGGGGGTLKGGTAKSAAGGRKRAAPAAKAGKSKARKRK
jgi:alpha-tubulin suppressor-like RCC1 family protein